MYNLPAFDKNMVVLAPSSRGLGHRPFKARTPVRIRLGLPGLQNHPFGWFFIFVKADPTGSVRAPRHIYVPHVNKVNVTSGAHDQYADEQLANLQKTDMVNRVFASRFGYWLSRRDVGAAKNQNHLLGGFYFWLKQTRPDAPECRYWCVCTIWQRSFRGQRPQARMANTQTNN